MLRFHRTSLMTSNSQTLVNTVNTVGVMGKGLAAAFKVRNPEMFSKYKTICKAGDLTPGSFWLWKGDDQWVLNFATKKHWRNPSKIKYVIDGLEEFRNTYEALGIREIAFPKLGCGNGGLDWSDVKPLMVEYLNNLPITVYIHDFDYPLGKPEHDLPLMKSSQPESFDAFYLDIKDLLSQQGKNLRALGHNAEFKVKICKDMSLREVDNCNELLATEEDLFRIWSLLLEIPVSKFDMPDTPHNHALKVFSILTELPYIRPVNIAGVSGRRPKLAIEMERHNKLEQLPS